MRDLADVLATFERLPEGTLLPVAGVVEMLREIGHTGGAVAVAANRCDPPPWPEKIWTVPANTRLGVAEVAEALGKEPNAIYKMCARGTIPCEKAPDRTWRFKAGALRDYIDKPNKYAKRARLRAAGKD